MDIHKLVDLALQYSKVEDAEGTGPAYPLRQFKTYAFLYDNLPYPSMDLSLWRTALKQIQVKSPKDIFLAAEVLARYKKLKANKNSIKE